MLPLVTYQTPIDNLSDFSVPKFKWIKKCQITNVYDATSTEKKKQHLKDLAITLATIFPI